MFNVICLFAFAWCYLCVAIFWCRLPLIVVFFVGIYCRHFLFALYFQAIGLKHLCRSHLIVTICWKLFLWYHLFTVIYLGVTCFKRFVWLSLFQMFNVIYFDADLTSAIGLMTLIPIVWCHLVGVICSSQRVSRH